MKKNSEYVVQAEKKMKGKNNGGGWVRQLAMHSVAAQKERLATSAALHRRTALFDIDYEEGTSCGGAYACAASAWRRPFRGGARLKI